MTLPTEYRVVRGAPDSKPVIGLAKSKAKLEPNDVAMKITHSGLCSTDLHFMDKDIVLGHEGVGVVQDVGSAVTKFKPGDRVGFGFVKDGCGECEACQKGLHFHCKVAPRRFGVGDENQGSFGEFAIWPDTNLHKIPDELSSEEAAPLLCAGITVFQPLQEFDMKQGNRVGIIGIGGLGHLAIQFAAKRGAEVVVFSSSEDKREEAECFGASEFYVTKDLANKKPEKGLDMLIITSTSHPDWPTFLGMLNPRGHVCFFEFTSEDLHMPYLTVAFSELNLHGGLARTPKEIQDTLEFAAKHGVKTAIETFPMTEEGTARALEKLKSGKMRYRGVFEI
ncbi:GroES-like protein [Rhizodiscina lignyota]|uniref:GroES-like protein n=1 Tax=Rhizodiscina lignyota TaxID=1504668 RepID=A0A9P4I7L9_9PEZI|nr:GroES-like protein [Rhizodiscina lignyota]